MVQMQNSKRNGLYFSGRWLKPKLAWYYDSLTMQEIFAEWRILVSSDSEELKLMIQKDLTSL